MSYLPSLVLLLLGFAEFGRAASLVHVNSTLRPYPGDEFASIQANDFYNSLDGVISVRVPTSPGPGVDLYLDYPKPDFSAADAVTLKSYLINGGRVVFFAEHNGPGGPGSATTNAALELLGSGLRFNGVPPIDGGGHRQTSAGQILEDSFTSGVSVLTYAAADSVSGGTPVFLASNLQSAIISYEKIGDGVLVAIGDTNFLDTLSSGSLNGAPDDNRMLFRNLLFAPVPEPSSAGLAGIGVLGFGALRGRIRSSGFDAAVANAA